MLKKNQRRHKIRVYLFTGKDFQRSRVKCNKGRMGNLTEGWTPVENEAKYTYLILY